MRLSQAHLAHEPLLQCVLQLLEQAAAHLCTDARWSDFLVVGKPLAARKSRAKPLVKLSCAYLELRNMDKAVSAQPALEDCALHTIMQGYTSLQPPMLWHSCIASQPAQSCVSPSDMTSEQALAMIIVTGHAGLARLC